MAFEKVLEREPVQITNPAEVIRFLFEVTNRTGQLKTPDEILVVRAQRKRDGNGLVLQTPRAREEGGKYYLNEKLMEAAGGGEFFSVGKKMMLAVPSDRIEAVVQFLNANDLPLAAFDQRQKARDMLGIELPSLELIQQNQFEAKADYVPYVPPVDTQVISSLEQMFQADFSSESDSSMVVDAIVEEISIPSDNETHASEIPESTDPQRLWALRLSNLSDELKSLLQPEQITQILTQPDPLSTIAKLKEAQPIFAAVYQELADLYTTATMNPSQTISSQAPEPETSLQTQLMAELEHIPASWALTPVDSHKAPYRGSWQTEPPLSREQLSHEISNGASGYGLRTGSISGGIVAIDLDGVSARAKMLELSGGIDLPKTVSFTSGREGRSQHLFLVPRELWSLIRSRKIATGIKGEDDKEEHVELRWQGLQSVLPPSVHPMTGQYCWLKSPQEVEIALVPNWVIDRMLVETKMVTVEQALSFNHPPVQANWTDQDWALSYLAALHPHRADDRDIWLKVGMALHSVSPALFSAWDQWSAQSQKYRPGECEYIWNRFQENGGITIATLGGWAKEDGWHFPVEAEHPVKADSESKVIDPVHAFQQQLDQHDPKTGEWLVTSEPHYPCLQEFKQWYFEAREIGRSQKYLDRIQELAEDFKAKTPEALSNPTIQNSEIPLSSTAITHLRQDSTSYQAQIDQFAKDAKTILKYKGKQVLLEGKPVYEYRSRNQDYLLRYHCTTKLVTVEKAGRTLLQYRVNHSTCQKAASREDFDCFHQQATRLREEAKIPPTSLPLIKSNEHER